MPFGNGIISNAQLTNCTTDGLGDTLRASRPSTDEFTFMNSESRRLGQETDGAKTRRQLADLKIEPLFFIEAMAQASDPNLSHSPHKKFDSELFKTFNSAISARNSEENKADWSDTEGHLRRIAEMEHPSHPAYNPIHSYDGFTTLYASRAASALSKPSLWDAVSSGAWDCSAVGLMAASGVLAVAAWVGSKQ